LQRPANRPRKKEKAKNATPPGFRALDGLRGSGKRVEGGRREKSLGAVWVVSRLPCIAFAFRIWICDRDLASAIPRLSKNKPIQHPFADNMDKR
jgi:hypothetical protein